MTEQTEPLLVQDVQAWENTARSQGAVIERDDRTPPSSQYGDKETFSADPKGVEAATKEKRKREQEGQHPWVTSDGYDQRGAIIEHKAP